MKSAKMLDLKKGHCTGAVNKADRVGCVKGMLWLTIHGCLQDYIVYEGEELSLISMRGVLIQALTDSRLRID